MVWRFYLPFTRKKMIVFSLLAIILEAITLITYKMLPSAESKDIILMLAVMYITVIAFSGLVFAKPKGRELQALLPACGLEKCIVIVGYVAVVVPVILSIPSLISLLIMGKEYPGVITAKSFIDVPFSASLTLYSCLFIIAMALTCLWAVFASKPKNAVRNALIAVGSFYVGFTVILSFIIGFISGFMEAQNGQSEDYLVKIYPILAIICGIYVIFALIKCCRAIKRGQY